MAGQLKGRSALVTGGGQGVGQGIARALAAEGADVMIAQRNRDAAELQMSERALESDALSARLQAAALEDELRQRLQELALGAAGHYGAPFLGEAGHNSGIGPQHSLDLAGDYFNGRKTSIYGGSNEIQRNIISKMVLGL